MLLRCLFVKLLHFTRSFFFYVSLTFEGVYFSQIDCLFSLLQLLLSWAVVEAIIMLRQILNELFILTCCLEQSKQQLYFLLFSWQESRSQIPQNVKTLLQVVVVVASVQACTVIKCFHYLYESPQQRRGLLAGRRRRRRCQPLDWRNDLIFFFGCFGIGGTGGDSKPWQRAATAV